MAVDTSGNVYVADSYFHRITTFTSDGTFLTKWQAIGSGIGELSSLPHGIAVDDSGTVYVTDMYNGRIQVFTSDGTFLGQWGSRGSGQGEFTTPLGIAVDGSGTIYVADTFNNRIQTFEKAGLLPVPFSNVTHSGSAPPPTATPGSVIFVVLGIAIAALPVGVVLDIRRK